MFYPVSNVFPCLSSEYFHGILFCWPNCFIYLFLHFLDSCQCGAAMRNFELVQMNFTAPQKEMQNIILVCFLFSYFDSNF